jgi:hypothetical protein
LVVLSAEQLSRMSRLLDEALLLSREGRQHWLDALGPEHLDLAVALREALLNSPEAANDLGKSAASAPSAPASTSAPTS